MTEAALPNELLANLMGAEGKKQIRFTEQIIDALESISPDLVPRFNTHPYVDAIVEGPSAFPTLLSLFETEEEALAKASILDAIAEINSQHYATAEVIDAVQVILSKSNDDAVSSMAARVLATAKHEGFLQQQSAFLASESPSQVRVAAKLVGYGQFEPAVERLLNLLQPENIAVADAVVWALGEIASVDALPTLHDMLTFSILSEEVIEAMGKIGDLNSVARLLAVLAEGTQIQREKAAQALGLIARNNRGSFDDTELQQRSIKLFEHLIENDVSLLVRFHAIVAHSLLGGHLPPAQITKALGARLSGVRMSSVADFFANRGPKV